jgi:D-xylose transport system substrate-binding protein
MSKHQFRKGFALLASVALVATVAACGGDNNDSSGSGSSSNSGSGAGDKPVTIGILFPDNQTPTWDKKHYPGIRDTIKKQCPDCKVLYGNVPFDAARQHSQAESMLAQGAKALILAPVDAASAGSIVTLAKSRGVPVIGYGNLPNGPLAGYVGVDVTELGRLQGQSLLDALKTKGDPKSGKIVALNGDAATPAVKDFVNGRKETLDPSVDIAKQTYIDNWDPANAQRAMDQAITALGKDSITGVYAMNDGIASGAAAALKNAGFKTPYPPITGNDADPAALQRILTGQQYSTVDVRAQNWGEVAGPVALKAARGEKLTSDKTVNSGDTKNVPWFTTPAPVTVTKDNLKKTEIDNGAVKLSTLCTPQYADACKAAGLE